MAKELHNQNRSILSYRITFADKHCMLLKDSILLDSNYTFRMHFAVNIPIIIGSCGPYDASMFRLESTIHVCQNVFLQAIVQVSQLLVHSLLYFFAVFTSHDDNKCYLHLGDANYLGVLVLA